MTPWRGGAAPPPLPPPPTKHKATQVYETPLHTVYHTMHGISADELLADPDLTMPAEVREMLQDGDSPEAIASAWAGEASAFAEQAEPYRLYD